MGDLEIIGHRGYAARAPENTLVAIDAALRPGSAAVAFDLRVASCGAPVAGRYVALDRGPDRASPVAPLTLTTPQAFPSELRATAERS